MDVVALCYELDKFAVTLKKKRKCRLLDDGKRHRNRSHFFRID